MSIRRRTHDHLPVVAALVVAVAGAGVLVVLWRLLDWPEGQSTWPDFRSGSLGDAVLLPVLTASLIQLGRWSTGLSSPRWPPAIGAVLGGMTGFAVQAAWWADPHPPANWTLVAPHQFSVAGAWHAFYFVIMAALLAGLWVDMLQVWRGLRRVDPQRLSSLLHSGAMVRLVYSVLTFSGLVTLDSAASSGTTSSAASLVSLTLTAGAVTLSVAWAAGRDARQAMPAALLGLVTAAVTILASRSWPPSGFAWAAIVGSLAAALLGGRLLTVAGSRTQRLPALGGPGNRVGTMASDAGEPDE